MRAAYLSPASWRGAPLGRRAASFSLAVAAHVLVVLLLLMLAPRRPPPPDLEPPLSTFTVLPQPSALPRTTPRASTAPTSRAAPAVAPPTPTTPVPLPPPVPVATPAPPVPDTKALDSFDLARLPTRGPGNSKTVASDSGPAYGPGEGPGGLRLFNAEWQREPTDRELGTYLPADMPRPAWAMIACRTVEDFHVENCRQLGEYPLGSGLARAMRLAAWQFRILPPRVGSRKLVGVWVRIRIDFTEAKPATP